METRTKGWSGVRKHRGSRYHWEVSPGPDEGTARLARVNEGSDEATRGVAWDEWDERVRRTKRTRE